MIETYIKQIKNEEEVALHKSLYEQSSDSSLCLAFYYRDFRNRNLVEATRYLAHATYLLKKTNQKIEDVLQDKQLKEFFLEFKSFFFKPYTNEFLEILGQMIINDPSLTILKLCFMTMDDSMGDSIIAALEVNINITKFSMSGSRFNDFHIDSLQDVLSSNRFVLNPYFNCSLTAYLSFEKRIIKLMERNVNLIQIDETLLKISTPEAKEFPATTIGGIYEA